MQRRHFVLVQALPLMALGPALAGVVVLGVPAPDWGVLVLMWLTTVIGIEVGYHRYFTHASFRTSEPVKAALLVLASTSGQGTVISWAANHRHHHQFADQPGDTHSPHLSGVGWKNRLRGFLHSHMLWAWSYPYPNPGHYVPHLVRDHLVTRLSRRYYAWLLLGMAVPTALGGLATLSARGALVGFLLGGLIRLVVCQQGTFLINSVCHVFGTRPYATRDRSRNNFWFSLVTLGGAWHNNHHAFPTSATNAHHWWQLDPSWYLLRILERAGVVWAVRRPNPAGRDKRRAGAGGASVPELAPSQISSPDPAPDLGDPMTASNPDLLVERI